MQIHFPILGTQLTQREVESLGDACVESFAEYLGIRLTTFKKHLVDDGAYVGHCYGEYIVGGKVILALEAVEPTSTRHAKVLHFGVGQLNLQISDDRK